VERLHNSLRCFCIRANARPSRRLNFLQPSRFQRSFFPLPHSRRLQCYQLDFRNLTYLLHAFQSSLIIIKLHGLDAQPPTWRTGGFLLGMWFFTTLVRTSVGLPLTKRTFQAMWP
ncbi:hypothetical protein L9F63_002275, partial [Diploptera punctata]